MRWVALGEIAVESKTIVEPGSTRARIRPYLGLEQIEANTGRIVAKEATSADGISSTFAFDERHVLYGKLRPYLNKVALPDYEGRCCTEIIPLLPVKVDREFLAFLLRTERVVNAAMSHKTGSRMPRADMAKLMKLKLRIPIDSKEQRRIAARLKAQLAEVETVRKQMAAQLVEVKKLRTKLQERILALMTHVRRRPLSDSLLGIEAGKSFQTSDRLANEYELGVLKVSAVTWSEFNANEAKAIDGDYQPDDRHRVRVGDILISRANTVELVGAVVQVDEDYPNRLLSDKTLRLLPDISRISPEFLVHMLRMPEARTHIENNATGTSDSMRNISQKTIFKIPIPIPEISVQKVVALQLNEIEYESRRIENAFRTIMTDISCLPGRLLAQAFEQ